MLGEQLFASIGSQLRKVFASIGQGQIALAQLRESQQLQRLGKVKQLAGLQLQLVSASTGRSAWP